MSARRGFCRAVRAFHAFLTFPQGREHLVGELPLFTLLANMTRAVLVTESCGGLRFMFLDAVSN